ncbi:hypothetical protein CDL12_22789 [Handroanthus impetiginosus]|uniref:Uncharacterized protein n=1 Tax=Handroanthus impetiginosus TaxID=429701 RepID=A0A2G9GHC1_9LAMI|nr:hypothetical protein CDL12_22789 [Handroanthus impetiginosus]
MNKIESKKTMFCAVNVCDAMSMHLSCFLPQLNTCPLIDLTCGENTSLFHAKTSRASNCIAMAQSLM